ncbi:hypothetical protein ACJ41O_001753 [Fusarium nematophilum]
MSTPTPGGFSLFPSPNSSKPPPTSRNQTPRPRRSESRERRAPTPQDRRAPTPQMSPEPQSSSQPLPRNGGRQTPQNRSHTPVEFETLRQQQYDDIRSASAMSQRQQQPPPSEDWPIQRPRPTVEIPGHAEASVSQQQQRPQPPAGARSSIAKPPLGGETSDQPQLRSIFPTYNPEVPLGQQNYVPNETNATQFPRAVVSRQTYYEPPQNTRYQGIRSPVRSPMSADSSTWPQRGGASQDPPMLPTTSTTEQLKSLWKVANGWQASASEGRVYCMKLAQEKDAPVYTLSSTSQPFYNLRIDPTSASAYVTLTRHDPNKAYKGPKGDAGAGSSAVSLINGVVGRDSGSSSSSGKVTDGKHWQEALSTALEEESRKHPPNDGLVALLMPTPATKMAVERAQDPSSVMMAERECARLVWDEDSSNHFLVHPALASPFCVTIERSPSWSRVEYTLEHNESPHHIAKLTRDGTGAGWLEIDTGIASKIESYFIVDVAVTALLIVASADEKNTPAMEVFEPPPPVLLSAKQEKRLSRQSKREDKKRRKMESFEIDVESQDESLGKGKSKEKDDKLPFLIRVIVKLVKGLFACFIWVLTLGFKCFGGVFKLAYKCVGSKY